MVDLVKIRNKKKKQGSAGVPPAEQAASPPPSPAAPPPEDGGEDAARSAGEDAGAPSKLDKFKAEAGKRRVVQTATEAQAEEQSHLELLTFVIANEHYAVDIERIVEIVTPRAVTRIPNADASVVGIISLRGTIVTLVDVRRKLRHPPAGEPGPDTRIVVIDFHHEIIGFLVDRVLRVVKTAAAEVERHPVVHATELDDSVRGVFRAGGALTILLDLDKLLDHGSLAVRSA
jgi:purine-binding chemotaxis protein CheW